MDVRKEESERIRLAYGRVEEALADVGKLLRTTEAGSFMWAGRHKTAVSGLKATVNILRYAVPRYDGTEA
jgi:hypothetical protein